MVQYKDLFFGPTAVPLCGADILQGNEERIMRFLARAYLHVASAHCNSLDLSPADTAPKPRGGSRAGSCADSKDKDAGTLLGLPLPREGSRQNSQVWGCAVCVHVSCAGLGPVPCLCCTCCTYVPRAVFTDSLFLPLFLLLFRTALEGIFPQA